MISLDLAKSDLAFEISDDYIQQPESRFKLIQVLINDRLNSIPNLPKGYYSNRVNSTIEEILKIYRLYYCGNKFKSFHVLRSLLNDYRPYLSEGVNKLLQVNQCFYRVRNGDIPIDKYQLFHIPFDKRYLVGNLRFNSPGIPCLYCANNLTTAINEIPSSLVVDAITGDSDEDEERKKQLLNFAVYKSSRRLPYLDLSFKKLPNEPSINDLSYLMLYPLIFAIHTRLKYEDKKVKYPNFKIEYLLPSMLMDWLFQQLNSRHENFFYGSQLSTICYSSTKSNDFTIDKNFVFAAKYDPGLKYCSELEKIFLKKSIEFYSNDIYSALGKMNNAKSKNSATSLESFSSAIIK